MGCHSHNHSYRNYQRKLIVILVFSVLLLVGCAKEEPMKAMSSTSFTEVDFEIVDVDSISDEAIIEWIEQSHSEKGIYRFDTNQRSQATTYVLISEGEKPTGGYLILVDQLMGYDDEIRVVSLLREPKKGDFVTQSFTYPYIILQIKQDEREIVLDR